MGMIRIASPSGDQNQEEEHQVRLMWEQGLLEEGTVYWREGMPEWRPIAELFHVPLRSPVSVSPPPLPASRYAYAKNPRSLTKFLITMLWFTLIMDSLSLLGDVGEMALLSSSFTEADAAANDARQALIGVVGLCVFIVTAVAFLKWVYRANANCRGFGAPGMRFTPVWSVGYYFIPFLNLVRPFQSMTEIWQASHSPTNWRTQKGSALLGWWWGLWLISGIVGQLSARLSLRAETLDELKSATAVSVIASAIGIPLCLVAIKLVKTIAYKQEQLVKPPNSALAQSTLPW